MCTSESWEKGGVGGWRQNNLKQGSYRCFKNNVAPSLTRPTALREQFTELCVNRIKGMITAGHSADRRLRNSEDSVLLSLLLLLRLSLSLSSGLWRGGFCSCYWVVLASDELLAFFLRFFLTRYTWKVLFWNVLVNREVYAAVSVLMTSQNRGWAAETRSGSFSPGPSMIWWYREQACHHRQQQEWQLALYS